MVYTYALPYPKMQRVDSCYGSYLRFVQCITVPYCIILRETRDFRDSRILRAWQQPDSLEMWFVPMPPYPEPKVSCQGWVGVAIAMAGAATNQLFGGSPAQIEYAAEMGLEHHLGNLHPVCGLVP